MLYLALYLQLNLTGAINRYALTHSVIYTRSMRRGLTSLQNCRKKMADVVLKGKNTAVTRERKHFSEILQLKILGDQRKNWLVCSFCCINVLSRQ